MPQPSYGGVVARGMAWTTMAVMLGRVTGFITNLILGWLLAPEDFGIYAVAIGLSVIALTQRSAGIQKLLIQRGAEYDQLAQPFARLSFMINTTAMLVLGLCGPIAASYFESPTVAPLLWIIGMSMPLAVPAEILRAKLAIDLRFRAIALANTGSMLLSQLMSIILALNGYGPFSFAWPMAIAAALESAILVGMLGWWPAGRKLNLALVRELFGAATWIILCGFAAAFIVHGSSLVVGRLETTVVTGLFYFGFQLTAAVALFFNTSLQRVLMPAMSRLSNEPQRQGAAYLRSVRILATVAAPVCGLGVVVAAPVVHFCWKGKWDESIQVFQPLMTVLPVYMMTAIGAALLEARGMWRANTILHFVSAIGTVTAAWLGASLGGLKEIALAAAAFRGGFGLLHGICITNVLDRRPVEFLREVVPPYVICLSAAWSVIGLMNDRLQNQSSVVQAAVLAGTYLMIVIALFAVFSRSRLRELRQTIRSSRSVRTPVVDVDAKSSASTIQ